MGQCVATLTLARATIQPEFASVQHDNAIPKHLALRCIQILETKKRGGRSLPR
jgi:hypothetical protein